MQLKKKRFKTSQPFLIDRIISFLGFNTYKFDTKTNSKASPVSKGLLHKNIRGKPCKVKWIYHTAVGMLFYLQGDTWPDISMAVHQKISFCINPQLTHEQSIKRLGQYLLYTRKEGIVFSPDKSKDLECYVNADFTCGWQYADVMNRFCNHVCRLPCLLTKQVTNIDRFEHIRI